MTEKLCNSTVQNLFAGEKRLIIYFKKIPAEDRWVKGDKYIRNIVRKIIRGKSKIGGVEKVFLNLKKASSHYKGS